MNEKYVITLLACLLGDSPYLCAAVLSTNPTILSNVVSTLEAASEHRPSYCTRPIEDQCRQAVVVSYITIQFAGFNSYEVHKKESRLQVSKPRE